MRESWEADGPGKARVPGLVGLGGTSGEVGLGGNNMFWTLTTADFIVVGVVELDIANLGF
jgi:hypothetical protein